MLQPVNRRNTWRWPTSAASPWMAEKTSVTSSRPEGSSLTPGPGRRSRPGRVVHARLGEAPGPEQACVAPATGTIAAPITRPGQVQRSIELSAQAHDLRLGHFDERCGDLDGIAFHSALLAGGGNGAERLDEFRSAVGIARVVDGVHPYPDAVELTRLGDAEGDGQEDAVPGRHVGRRNGT